MTERVVSLPMYDIPEVAAANDAWWAGIARHLAAAGVANVPSGLSRPGEGADFWLRPDMLFSQTCGYPLVTELAGKARLLAVPCYDAPGCRGADYSSLIIVGSDGIWKEFGELRGATCAVNSANSWSGHHALRVLIAQEGGRGGLLCSAIESGSHAASIAAVAAGRADFAAIDCVTHAILSRYRPDAVLGTRILCRTPAMPGLPLIAGKAAEEGEIEAMREGLSAAAVDPELAGIREALGITGVNFPRAVEYERLLMALETADAAGVGPLL